MLDIAQPQHVHFKYSIKYTSASYVFLAPDMRSNFNISRAIGALCQIKSNISIGLTSVPAINILNFCHKCGSGKKGANARNIVINNITTNGILSSHFINHCSGTCFALNDFRNASTRLRFTPKSEVPVREADLTWINFSPSTKRNTTSSTNRNTSEVNVEYR